MKIKFKREKSFGLTGNPLGHSISPAIHSELLSIADISADYELYELSESELPEAFENKLKSLNGFNVTIPHKLNIIPLLDELSPRAELFGSVNTVLIDGEKTVGYNTDCAGFLRSLSGAVVELGGRVLVLGSGGVSRMFAFESVLAGADVTVAHRPSGIERAQTLKAEIKSKLGKEIELETLDGLNSGYDLIINGTPVGMYPNVDASPIKKEVLDGAKAVFDAIYNPPETLLLKYARELGIKGINGLSMLVWQAAVAEEIWNGVKFSESDVNGIIERLSK